MSIGLLYGGTGADVFLKDANADGIPEFATTVVYTVWTALTGGTQLTELYTYPAQAATTTLSPDATGRLLFYNANGVTARVYLRNEAATGDTRWGVDPSDIASRAGVTAHSALTGLPVGDDHPQYLNNARGDARYLLPATAASTYVALTGNQTVAGVKTFSSAPVVPANSFPTTAINGFTAALATKPDSSGSVKQFADVPDAALNPGEVYTGDGAGALEALDLTAASNAFDATTGDLLYASEPPFTILGFIKNAGDPDPAGLPLGAGIPVIGWSRPASASIIPIFDDDATATAASTATGFVTTQDYAVGDDLLFVVGLSDEAGSAGADATVTFSFGVGAAAQTLKIAGRQAATAKVIHYNGKCTTHIPVGVTITPTFKDVTGVTTQNRALAALQLIKLPNLAAVSPFDQSVGIGAGGSGTLALTIGPTGPTTQPVEVAIQSAFMSGGGPPAIRTMNPTNGWSLLKVTEVDSGSSSRMLMSAFKVLSATGAVTGNYTVGASGVGVFDNATGGHGDCISTWKSS